MKKIGLYLFLSSCFYVAMGQAVKIDSSKYPKLTTFTGQQDHDNMKQQLGITKLRPGRNGNESAPDHANYDEAMANPCPQLPDVLALNSRKKITTADEWWKQRRPELIEEFEREVYGRIPKKHSESYMDSKSY